MYYVPIEVLPASLRRQLYNLLVSIFIRMAADVTNLLDLVNMVKWPPKFGAIHKLCNAKIPIFVAGSGQKSFNCCEFRLKIC